MKNLLKGLFYDRAMIDNLKQANLDQELVYNQLLSGKITLREYLKLIK